MSHRFINQMALLARLVNPVARSEPIGVEQWQGLIALATQHGVRPLLYRAAKQGDAPADVLAELRAFALNNARRNLALTAELLRVLDALRAAEIAALAFKGPTLAALVFGDVGMREFGDLDLLIAKDNFARASRVLCDLGYAPQIGGAVAAPAILDAYRVVAFSHSEKDWVVELHWELAPQYLPFPADFGQLRTSALQVETAGRSVLTLPLDDLFIYLCNHGAKHHWESLGWVADIAWLIESNPALDWGRVLARADALGNRRLLLVGAQTACVLCGVTLPSPLSDALRTDPGAERLAKQVMHWLLNETEPGASATVLFLLRLRTSWKERLAAAYFLLAAPNLADWEFVQLPRALRFLYPFVRLLRILSGRFSENES